MMEEVVRRLHTGGYSCVIANKEEVRTFVRRGVADLYALLTQQPDFLNGALVADKVVGKGAAALMVLGGVGEVYADVVSEGALSLFQASGVPVRFVQKVPFIWNRQHTGVCPVESLCAGETSVHTMFSLITDFLMQH